MPVPSGERTRASVPAGDVSGPGTGSATGTFAFTAPGPRNSQLLYLIDTKSKAFLVYSVNPDNPKGTLKLEAARQYQWDLKLSEYNNLEPGVASIESMVKSLGQERR